MYCFNFYDHIGEEGFFDEFFRFDDILSQKDLGYVPEDIDKPASYVVVQVNYDREDALKSYLTEVEDHLGVDLGVMKVLNEIPVKYSNSILMQSRYHIPREGVGLILEYEGH